MDVKPLTCFVLFLSGHGRPPGPRVYFAGPPHADMRALDVERAMKFKSLAAVRRGRRELGLGSGWRWQKIATADPALIARTNRMLVGM